MSYLPLLSEDEVHYICSVIPHEHTIAYFQKTPKELAKVRPGFRAKAISKDDACKLLVNHRNRGFVSSFIEKHISEWLAEIKAHIDKCIENGNSMELAYINTLPFCFFANNIALYYKLIDEDHSEEYVSLLSAAVLALKDAADEQRLMQKDLLDRESGIIELRAELDSIKADLERTSSKLTNRLIEIKRLKQGVSGIATMVATEQDNKQMIDSLKAEIQGQDEIIKELSIELSKSRNSIQELETKRVEFEEQQAATKEVNHPSLVKPKRPNELEEFKDYLGYNLKSLGIPSCSEYYPLLEEHLSKILFQGVPIVINRCVGPTLMRCVANTIVGQPYVNTLVYGKETSINDVEGFLLSGERVICLDNFVGNCNETELLPLFDKHKDKIIFLTVAYERTILYISQEFFRYSHYLNLNRIPALSANATLTEDPSIIEEVEFEPQGITQNNRYSSLLRKMLHEFGFPESITEQKCHAIYAENDLCRTLAFDILPYCMDVLQIAPYNTSERFNEYAVGRCAYKKLFSEWFAR